MTSRSSSSLARRPTTPKSSEAPQQLVAPPIPSVRTSISSNPPASRRTTLGFLRRSKSGDPVRKMPIVDPSPPKLPDVQVNGSVGATGFPRNLFGKDVRDSVDILSGKFGEEAASNGDPRKQNHPALGGFVAGRKSTDSVIGSDGGYVRSSSLPITEDPYSNVGSITNRGRYSFASTSAASTVNPPRRVRRRKDPTPFNVLVIGAKNSGKTSFIRFLGHSLSLKKRGQIDQPPQTDHTGATSDSPFKSTYLETEIDGERIGLTLWDSAGLEKNMVDLQLRETVGFIEAKFEDTFSEETKVVRAPGVRDTHIHCVFLLLDPARLTPGNHYLGKTSSSEETSGLNADLDISVFKALHGKTVVIPVISKADTCTNKHMEYLKDVVRKGLAAAHEDPLESLELEVDEDEVPVPVAPKGKRSSLQEVDEEEETATRDSGTEEGPVGHDDEEDDEEEIDPNRPMGITAGLSFIPLSVISPDSYDPSEPVGRHFPWGFADPYNEKHCDFTRLKDSVFSEWRAELREKSRENWYENWRSDRLGSRRRL